MAWHDIFLKLCYIIIYIYLIRGTYTIYIILHTYLIYYCIYNILVCIMINNMSLLLYTRCIYFVMNVCFSLLFYFIFLSMLESIQYKYVKSSNVLRHHNKNIVFFLLFFITAYFVCIFNKYLSKKNPHIIYLEYWLLSLWKIHNIIVR